MPSASAPEATRLLVLDLDGTLVSLDVRWGELRAELARLAADAGLDARGPGIRALMEGAALCGYEPARAAMEAALTAAETAGAERPLRNEALIEWLDRPGLPATFSVLSLNSRVAVERAIRAVGLADRVDAIVGREDVTHGKPDPEGLTRLARSRCVPTRSVLFVGDHPADRECAVRAGARYVDVAEVGLRWAR